MKMASLWKSILLRIKWSGQLILVYSMRLFPIKQNKVVFVNYYGRGYGDNAKYICESLLKNHPSNMDIVWATKEKDASFPDNVRPVQYPSLQYLYELCTAKVWVDNCRKDIYIRKRPEQFYIQTWHGDLIIKKIENDAKKALARSYINSAKNDSKMADLFIAGNEWMVDLIHQSMWYTGRVEKCGYPRRDILYSITETEKLKIRHTCGIADNVRIVLYVPTFRKEQENPDLSVYDIDWTNVLNALSKRFGGKWIALIRLHPNIARFSSWLKQHGDTIDVTNYSDLQELMAISDICISDYSSSILEFAITGKPGFIYAVDYEKYKLDRNVYFELEDLPFPIAYNNQQLAGLIESFDLPEYKRKNLFFYQNTIKSFKEGNASKIVADIIHDHLI